MGIGVSVFLIALGAILAFAINFIVPHVNLFLVGIILMVVGLVGLVTTMAVWGPRRRAVDTYEAYGPDDRPVRRVVREDREVY